MSILYREIPTVNHCTDADSFVKIKFVSKLLIHVTQILVDLEQRLAQTDQAQLANVLAHLDSLEILIKNVFR